MLTVVGAQLLAGPVAGVLETIARGLALCTDALLLLPRLLRRVEADREERWLRVPEPDGADVVQLWWQSPVLARTLPLDCVLGPSALLIALAALLSSCAPSRACAACSLSRSVREASASLPPRMPGRTFLFHDSPPSSNTAAKWKQVAVPRLRQVLRGATTPPAWKIPAPCRVVRAEVVVMCTGLDGSSRDSVLQTLQSDWEQPPRSFCFSSVFCSRLLCWKGKAN